MSELKEKYIEVQRKVLNNTYAKILSSTVGLDQQGSDEIRAVFESEDLSREIYTNTLGIHPDEAEVERYLELFLKQYELIEEMKSIVPQEDIEKGVEKCVSSFVEHHNETFNKIYTEAFERQGL